MLLSVIMPCYNEADTLAEILAQVQAVEIDKEIIAVDDHSSDDT
ncbi:MAG TPA: glycosyltransferase, partial [Roseiflexaceae bacterium]|nr:glycosyltransferase [Roseiflexaceae bacterium]